MTGALLFALHPVQVETVAWASGLKDVLGGLFAVLCIDRYLRRDGRPFRFMLSGTFLVLAMLSKPNAVVAPFIAAALDWLVLRRPWRDVLRSAGPLVVLTIPCIVWSRMVQP